MRLNKFPIMLGPPHSFIQDNLASNMYVLLVPPRHNGKECDVGPIAKGVCNVSFNHSLKILDYRENEI